jgi:hypothetical protein
MDHHVIYWRLARREDDVDDAALTDLLHLEERGEAYVEFLDGRRRRLVWDHDRNRWMGPRTDDRVAA